MVQLICGKVVLLSSYDSTVRSLNACTKSLTTIEKFVIAISWSNTTLPFMRTWKSTDNGSDSSATRMNGYVIVLVQGTSGKKLTCSYGADFRKMDTNWGKVDSEHFFSVIYDITEIWMTCKQLLNIVFHLNKYYLLRISEFLRKSLKP